jgi:glycosyltransferase involved in cell wall biosynthesis
MKLSVIVPVYNEENVIYDFLVSLANQSLDGFEVIVVDDGSTDKTLDILSELRFKNYDLRILKQNHKGAGAARNLGASKATGDILVFVDADMTFDRNFLKNLVSPIISGKAKGTFSKEEYVSNWDNVWARCWNINENWQEKRRHPKNYPDKQPVFRAILKSEFDKVGGFTPGGYDDDWSLYRKLGFLAENAPGAIFYHKNPDNLKEIFNHAKWVGKRNYKMGFLGYVVALLRASFPFSLLIGIYKGIKNNNLRFLIFKIVYDFGISLGVLEMILKGRMSK